MAGYLGTNAVVLSTTAATIAGPATISGSLSVIGAATAATFAGDGSALTSLTSANLTGALPAIDGSSLTGINAFKPTTVTGATPSLNVGSFNYFDNGTLTADTTVSFASVPTDANWRYSFEAGNTSTSFSWADRTFVNSFSVSAQAAAPYGLYIGASGTRMYHTDGAGTVYQYSLSTAWDMSTASYDSVSFNASAQTDGLGLAFSTDGTKMYLNDNIGGSLYQYTLSTAWDLSTASYASKSLNTSGQVTYGRGVAFKDDGTKVFVNDEAGEVNEYSLSTAWDVSTGSFSASYSTTNPSALAFNSDGTVMYTGDGTGGVLYRHTLSTAWSVSTASLSNSDTFTGLGAPCTDIFVEDTVSNLYTIDTLNDAVRTYFGGVAASVSLPASVENPPSGSFTIGNRVTYEFVTADGGTTVTLIAKEVTT